MRSQLGASVLSQVLQELAFDRGLTVDFHQQLNIGGNTDFNNMMVQSRLASKKKSKENVIRAQNDLRNIPVAEHSLFAGPSTYYHTYKIIKLPTLIYGCAVLVTHPSQLMSSYPCKIAKIVPELL